MIKREEINGVVFMEQTTYYLYRSEESLQNDEPPFLTTSDKDNFEKHKELIRNEELVLKPKLKE